MNISLCIWCLYKSISMNVAVLLSKIINKINIKNSVMIRIVNTLFYHTLCDLLYNPLLTHKSTSQLTWEHYDSWKYGLWISSTSALPQMHFVVDIIPIASQCHHRTSAWKQTHCSVIITGSRTIYCCSES